MAYLMNPIEYNKPVQFIDFNAMKMRTRMGWYVTVLSNYMDILILPFTFISTRNLIFGVISFARSFPHQEPD